MRSLALLALLALVLSACESGAAAGVTCSTSSQCGAPLVCRLARCRSECAANRDCPIGARCLLSADGLGACSVDNDDRCESGGTACPSGLTCLGGRCVNTCASVDECPDDGECREAAGTGLSFCFAPDREDGGSPGDASVPTDAGPRALGRALDVCVGEAFACAVREDHHVLCWGANDHRQLGDGTTALQAATHGRCQEGPAESDCSPLAVEVLRDSGDALLADRIACASGTTCAAETGTGLVVCWGAGGDGELVTTTEDAARAIEIPELPADPRALFGGRAFFCGSFGTAEEAYCWGQAGRGQWGVDPTTASNPAHARAWDGAQLALGSFATCGLADGGTVTCAGSNDDGALGPTGMLGTDSFVPLDVTLTGSPSELRAGDGFACARIGGGVSCWGDNSLGSLGRGAPEPNDPIPAPIAGGDTFDALWVGGFTARACGRRAGTGEVLCWGALASSCESAGGACGRPRELMALEGATLVASGPGTSCAILADGHVVCGGTNAYGELGRGTSGALDAFDTRPSAYVGVCLDPGCR